MESFRDLLAAVFARRSSVCRGTGTRVVRTNMLLGVIFILSQSFKIQSI